MTAKIVKWETYGKTLSDGSYVYSVLFFDEAGKVVGEIDCEDEDRMDELISSLYVAAI